MDRDQILLGDNLELMEGMEDGSFQLIYADPPFNTGKVQARKSVRTVADEEGDRTGFGGRRYRTETPDGSEGEVTPASYADAFDDFTAFLEPRLEEMHRLLAETGTLYLHIDYREAHYVKVTLDGIFGRECFLNEIIWSYDYGGKSKRRWPAKHDTILVYVKDPDRYYFDSTEVDREPYMAPGLVTPEKAAKGKLPTDVWWHTIVPTNGAEKTGYPTQKPEGIIRRMVTASSRPGDLCLDPFCGSGTLGAVCRKLDRGYVLIDSSPEAIEVASRRLNPG
ncbi:MAG: site-specific DNA-methyltransferase [Solirubrobacterales bacterium]|nr:site-specific DNA-methyltransferase [Solirubrobacterales bacterium]